MSINEIGSLKGRKVISDKTGDAAKTSHGDKVNEHASSHTTITVPKGSQDHTDPTSDVDDSHRSIGY